MLLAVTQCQCYFKSYDAGSLFTGQNGRQSENILRCTVLYERVKLYGVSVYSFGEYKEQRIMQTCLIRFLFTETLALTFVVC